MKKALQEMAQEISQSLMREIETYRTIEGPTSGSFGDLLCQQLAEVVVNQLGDAGLGAGPSYKRLEERLLRAEEKLEKLVTSANHDDEDEKAGTRSRFPNLKYAKPKYQNVESLLNYVEKDGDKGGLKLVIMNFND